MNRKSIERFETDIKTEAERTFKIPADFMEKFFQQ